MAHGGETVVAEGHGEEASSTEDEELPITDENQETVVAEGHEEDALAFEEDQNIINSSIKNCNDSYLPMVDENEEIKLLCELVGGYKLARDDGCKDLNETIKPYCTVKFGGTIIHRTKTATEGGPNPIWTVSTGAFFLLECTPRELVQNDLQISIWFKQKDPLKLTILGRLFLGKADVDLSKVIQAHCHGERLEVDLKDGEVDTGSKYRGTLTLRFRLATASDEKFLALLQKRPELLKQRSTPNITVAENESACNSGKKESASLMITKSSSLLITEANESQLAGESFMNALSSAFTSKRYFDNSLGQEKVLIKPNPDPDRVQETTYLTKEEIQSEILAPSKEWIQAGSGKLGRLYLEILSCDDLPNVDVGEAVGNVTDAFVCAVFEDAMVQTPVIDDELSPRWLPWTQRAFVFSMMHPASMLYLGTFDYDLGISNHEALGRVAVNISNFQRDTEYTLKYNLYPSTNVTDRTAVGSIMIRLRIEYNDEREALLAALKPRPKFHINVRKEKSLSVLRYTCFGEFGDDNEQSFDLTVTRSYINEILEYKRALSYCFGDAFRSLIFWRGQVAVGNIRLPLHSLFFFCFATTLVERPYLAPPFFLISVAWVMLAAQTQRRQHPSPWHQCHSFWCFLEILRTGRSSALRGINAYQGAEMAESYEKEWQERLKKDQKFAETQAAMQQEIRNIGDEEIHTKISTGIPLDILVRLTRYQGIIGRVCLKFRFVKILVTWEESVVSFWITACFLGAGLLSLLLPWSFIILWSSRIVVHGAFGPHMKLVDWWLQENGKDDAVLKKAMDNFQKESRSARIRHQEAVKLRDLKELAFGKFITLVPSHNLSRHYDRPLAGSSARLYRNNDIKLSPNGVPGQQLFGVVLPRTEPEVVQYEKETLLLQTVEAELATLVTSIKNSEDYELIKRLKSQECLEEDLPAEVGYELVSFDGVDPCQQQEAHVQVTEAMSLSLAQQSNVAILHKGKAASSRRRRSSTFRGGYELIAVDESINDSSGLGEHKSIRIGENLVELDAGQKLAILESPRRRSSIKHAQSWSAGDYPPFSLTERTQLGILHETDEERESGEVEIVLGAPTRDDVSSHEQNGDTNSYTQGMQSNDVDGLSVTREEGGKQESEPEDDASTVYYQPTTTCTSTIESNDRRDSEAETEATIPRTEKGDPSKSDDPLINETQISKAAVENEQTGVNEYVSADEESVLEFQSLSTLKKAHEETECYNLVAKRIPTK